MDLRFALVDCVSFMALVIAGDVFRVGVVGEVFAVVAVVVPELAALASGVSVNVSNWIAVADINGLLKFRTVDVVPV